MTNRTSKAKAYASGGKCDIEAKVKSEAAQKGFARSTAASYKEGGKVPGLKDGGKADRFARGGTTAKGTMSGCKY